MVDIATPHTAERRGAARVDALRRRGGLEPSRRPTVARRDRSPADLARLVEGDIIPRLMLAYRAADDAVGPETQEAFARRLLSQDGQALAEHVEALVRGGLPLERVYADLLAPAARRLGDDWNEDEISFTDVTVGLSRLQHAVRALAVRFPSADARSDGRAACFVTSPGEQHAFGLYLVEDAFRRAGWRTHIDTAATLEDAAEAVASDWFDVLGLSATSDGSLAGVATTIALARRRSLNPRLFVMVGGRLFIDDPELVSDVGADAAAATAGEALCVADEAVRRPALV